MTEKIDTQGMSGPSSEGCKDNVFPKDEDGNPIYPEMKITPLTLLEPQLRIELKDLINEVLDEREYNKKMNGPYDMPEEDEPTYTEYKHPWYEHIETE